VICFYYHELENRSQRTAMTPHCCKWKALIFLIETLKIPTHVFWCKGSASSIDSEHKFCSKMKDEQRLQ